MDIDDIYFKISLWLPKRFLYVCIINVFADVTTRHGDLVVTDVKVMDALSYYRNDNEIG